MKFTHYPANNSHEVKTHHLWHIGVSHFIEVNTQTKNKSKHIISSASSFTTVFTAFGKSSDATQAEWNGPTFTQVKWDFPQCFQAIIINNAVLTHLSELLVDYL